MASEVPNESSYPWKDLESYLAYKDNVRFAAVPCKKGIKDFVTGGSDGIGKAYAMELACRGVNIFLISKEEKKLRNVVAEIESSFQVKAEYLCVDFSLSSDAGLYKKIWEHVSGKDIGILVNNVGVMYDYPQPFLEVSVKKLWQLINVNIATATMMTHMVLPDMVTRGRGAIVNISSWEYGKVTPQLTVYAATKSYLDYFSHGLEFEYRKLGITVQSLTPFYVATRMTAYSQMLSKKSTTVPSAATYARSAVRTLGFSRRTSGYFPHLVQMGICKLFPDWLWKELSSRVNTSLRCQAMKRRRHSSVSASPRAQETAPS